ncbi:SUN domain-containing protein 5-like [Varroa jacobsoni]|uniref:SUN domain-containing protein 5-like n=1 Tax=Varroa jacobsoni TaxID=62625 RepID=UPI000BF99F69|nr:SUN domain-containing protein 5-like [Varroa jacobsoni]
MRSSIISLPFVALYLIHAWLFTFDVLLLSRRRARTPVAVGTLCVLFGTLIYVIVTCGNLPQLEMRLPDFDFHNLYFPGRRSAGKQPYVPWEPASGNFGTASCVSEGNNIYPDGQQASQQRQKDMCFLPKKTIAPGISHHILESQQELGTSQERQLDTSGNPQQQLNAAENCQDSGQINFSGFSVPPVLPCAQCPDNRDWFLEQLAHLSRRVDHLQAQVDKCDCGSLKVGQVGPELDAAIRRALMLYDADKTGMADYALESAGGSVLSTRCTETYDMSMGRYYLFGFIPLFWHRPSPRLAIQPTLSVGQCWPFKGSIGYLVVRLSRRVVVDAFALEHIPASLAPAGNIDSSPNHFEVFGLENEDDTVGVFLGSYSYTTTGEPLQHFKVQADVGDRSFDTVELKILTNHGNLHYTCLYRFRVHGRPVHDDGLW